MQQKILIIGEPEIGFKAQAYLWAQGHVVTEIISEIYADKKGIDARYFTNEERAVHAIEIIKQNENRKITRRERRLGLRKSKKR